MKQRYNIDSHVTDSSIPMSIFFGFKKAPKSALARKSTWGWNSFREFRDSVDSIPAQHFPALAGCLGERESPQQNPMVWSKLIQPMIIHTG